MPTSYTNLLGLALPVTGELSGTWGDEVNNYITQYLDASVAGTQTISGSQTAVTLSKTTNASLSQAGSGATGSSQYLIINCTGNPASLLTITAPAASKPYIVINGTSTSQSVKIVGAGPTTGVTIPAGQRALVAWNGSDFVQVGASAGGSNTQVQYNDNGALAGSANFTFNGTTATINTLNLTNALGATHGGTGQSTYATGDILYASASNTLSKLAAGTNGYVLTLAGGVPTWAASSGGVTTFSAGTTGFTPSTATSGAITLAGTLSVANGGTGQTSYTNGQLLIGNTTGNTLTKATLTAGSGISITNGTGSITIAATGGTAGIGSVIYLQSNFGGF